MEKRLIKLAEPSELGEITDVYEEARAFMALNGNPTQWGPERYPRLELLRRDIELKRLYVMKRGESIDAVFVLAEGEEPTYAVIKDGAWKDDKPYLTIHRLASRTDAHGCGRAVLEYCAEKAKEKGLGLRADTHEDNAPMLHILEGFGFEYCGIISVRNGSKRRAYQMIT